MKRIKSGILLLLSILFLAGCGAVQANENQVSKEYKEQIKQLKEVYIKSVQAEQRVSVDFSEDIDLLHNKDYASEALEEIKKYSEEINEINTTPLTEQDIIYHSYILEMLEHKKKMSEYTIGMLENENKYFAIRLRNEIETFNEKGIDSNVVFKEILK